MLKTLLLILLTMIISSGPQIFAQKKKVFCRYSYDNSVHYGKVEGKYIYQLNKAPWYGGKITGTKVSLKDVKFLSPSKPHVIIGLIKSYSDSWKGKTPPKTIRWFIKPSTSAATTGDDIIIPLAVSQLKFEDELVIVIGKRIKNVNSEEAEKAIFGYSLGADVEGNPDSYYKVHHEPEDPNKAPLTLGLKIGDGFAPFGPFITQGVNWKKSMKHVHIVNPESGKDITYEHNVSDLMYKPAEIVSQLSKVLTLMPGDVIFTGSAKAFVVGPGDKVKMSIDGLGNMTNKVILKNK